MKTFQNMFKGGKKDSKAEKGNPKRSQPAPAGASVGAARQNMNTRNQNTGTRERNVPARGRPSGNRTRAQNRRQQKNVGGRNRRANQARGAGNPSVQSNSIKNLRNSYLTFGNVIEDFLNSTNIGGQRIQIEYNHSKPEGERFTEFKLFYSEKSEFHINDTEVETTLDDYLKNKNAVLGGDPPISAWALFRAKLELRLNLVIDATPNRSMTKNVIDAVTKHLTPIEKIVVSLNESNWNLIDTSKLDIALNEQRKFLNDRYGVGGRATYLTKQINGTDQSKPIKPIEWSSVAVGNWNEGSVLYSFGLHNKETGLADYAKKIESAAKNLLGEEEE